MACGPPFVLLPRALRMWAQAWSWFFFKKSYFHSELRKHSYCSEVRLEDGSCLLNDFSYMLFSYVCVCECVWSGEFSKYLCQDLKKKYIQIRVHSWRVNRKLLTKVKTIQINDSVPQGRALSSPRPKGCRGRKRFWKTSSPKSTYRNELRGINNPNLSPSPLIIFVELALDASNHKLEGKRTNRCDLHRLATRGID